MVLQISSCGELLTTAGLGAHKGLLPIVGPHVHLQPLQHIETFPTTFCRADEGAVISAKKKIKKFHEQQDLKMLFAREDKSRLLRLSGQTVNPKAGHIQTPLKFAKTADTRPFLEY